MTAFEVISALGGRPFGGRGTCRCPVPSHGRGRGDVSPSLSIAEGVGAELLVKCHAGCDPRDVLAELRGLGLLSDNLAHGRPRLSRQAAGVVGNDRKVGDDGERTKFALALWHQATPAAGTLVETYLRSRGLGLPAAGRLRFHAGLKHPSGDIWPAMIALVTRGSDDTPLAIHRTFLARDGVGKAPVDPQKMMLGPCRGGAVRLASADGLLMIGEGVETTLAAMKATGYRAWAAMSTSGLLTLDLPVAVRDVILLADGDDPGEAAATAAADRWGQEGRTVRIASPPNGSDFNDLLRADG